MRRAEAEPGAQRFDFGAAGLDLACQGHVEPLRVDGQLVGGLIVFRDREAADEMDSLLVEQAGQRVTGAAPAERLCDGLVQVDQGTEGSCLGCQ